MCVALGIGIGFAYVQLKPKFAQWFLSKPTHYASQNHMLLNKYNKLTPSNVEWSQLLPQEEKGVLKKYQQLQATSPTEFTENLLLSIEAASDPSYSAAMTSVNSVDAYDGKAVSIAGFIVPIDYSSSEGPANIFIVPYFGACIHFPPPPPNQMIFAQLEGEFTDFDISQAYKITGIMRRGLFEDPLGTSAYILDVVSIEAYFDKPDDFRQH